MNSGSFSPTPSSQRTESATSVTAASVPSSAEPALAAIRTASTEDTILLDFDETLFLRNSTQEYLRSVKPEALGAMVLLGLNVVKPWQWLASKTDSHALRDWCRVVVVTLLFPWTLLIWRRRASKLSEQFTNQAIIEALGDHPQASVVVASNGFHWIISPLLRSMAMPRHQLIACRFWAGWRDRQRGKVSLVTAAIGADSVDRALLLTDSEDDTSLLDRVAMPHLVIWPDARCISALDTAYLPLFYMQRVKKKGTDNFLKVTLLNEFLPLVLMLSWLSPHPLLHGLGLALLFFSFWCIYEVGYMENDLVAEHHEENPTLSANYQKYKGKINYSEPWLWATVSALPGILLWQVIEQASMEPVYTLSSVSFNSLIVPAAGKLLLWLASLVLLRLTYWIYNYIDEQTRVWIYPVLQVFKYANFLLLTAGSSVVLIYFSAQVLARWIPYLIYRNGNLKKFPIFPMQLARLVIFLFLLIPLSIVEGVEGMPPLFTSPTVLIIAISVYRAKTECLKVIRQIKPLSVDFSSLAKALNFSAKSIFQNPFSL